jgi:catechol 2,3-dioxygenase-like lactoylglutathione lyase family enzyme
VTPLGTPETAVLGATDLAATVAFLSIFGCVARTAPAVGGDAAQALYGVDGPLRQVVLETPGAVGRLRVVETPHAPQPFAPLRVGPYGLDFYASDVELSIALARATGAEATELVEYAVHGAVMLSEEPQFETRYVGPDALSVYVTDIAISGHVFPTVLDREPQRLHSEPNMLCWVVDDLDAARAFWTGEAGLEVVVDRFEGAEGMLDLMAHPYPTPLRTVNVADADRTRRIELMHYTEAEVDQRPSWPLHGGLHAAGFEVDDLDAAIAALPSARFEPPCIADDGRGPARAAAGSAPGGVRFELWERRLSRG